MLTASHEYCSWAQSSVQLLPAAPESLCVLSFQTDPTASLSVETFMGWAGCSISQASLSIMYDLVQETLEEAMELDAVFHELMGSRAGLMMKGKTTFSRMP